MKIEDGSFVSYSGKTYVIISAENNKLERPKAYRSEKALIYLLAPYYINNINSYENSGSELLWTENDTASVLTVPDPTDIITFMEKASPFIKEFIKKIAEK